MYQSIYSTQVSGRLGTTLNIPTKFWVGSGMISILHPKFENKIWEIWIWGTISVLDPIFGGTKSITFSRYPGTEYTLLNTSLTQTPRVCSCMRRLCRILVDDPLTRHETASTSLSAAASFGFATGTKQRQRRASWPRREFLCADEL